MEMKLEEIPNSNEADVNFWRTDSKAFAKLIITALTQVYADEKPDLVERLSSMIEIHISCRKDMEIKDKTL